MNGKLNINIRSEIGELEGVILHAPGPEVENMTPANVERALYSDILNLSVAKKEYAQLNGILNKVTKTYQVKDLLSDILVNEKIKSALIDKVCLNENVPQIKEFLHTLDNKELAAQLVEGVVLKKDNLTAYLSKERFVLKPLHNFFYMRDSSISMLDEVLIARMANNVRERESIIMEAIFDYSDVFNTKTVNPVNTVNNDNVSIEGGDILIARDDILIIGNGCRTTTQGVDFIIKCLKAQKERKRHILVQELPYTPESFIHLDMVFTFLDIDFCMVYEPLILKPTKYQTIHIEIENGKVSSIKTEKNLLESLKDLGMDLKPICCGGKKDLWAQEREQWHSGANFFAIAPGKVIGYERNVYTLQEMGNNGFEIVKANDIIKDKVDCKSLKKAVIALEGSELPRGGGGARCMTMPVSRKAVKW